MTIEQYILERSYLPKTGTHTLEEHLMAMQMSILGVCTALVIEDEVEGVQIIDVVEQIVIESMEPVQVTDSSDEIIIEDVTTLIEEGR